MSKWELDESKLNRLQINTLRDVVGLCKAAHYANVEIRINGQTRVLEADWLKHLTPPKETTT